jgi:hypothetical protein
MSILTEIFPNIKSDTLYSIVSLEYQKRMKMNHIKSQTNINKYWDLYQQAVKNHESPGIILKIAEQFDICPCLIAKLIPQKYFEDLNLTEQAQINNYLRDTSLIPLHEDTENIICI